MKRLLIAASIFSLGLFIVGYFFHIDILRLAGGFGQMLVDMFTATRP